MAVTTPGLPTLYDYYTSGGITSGLNPNFTDNFQLNERNITLYSGAMHYFRIPPQYWRDRLRKLRASGLNTVETYIPWNLHEPEPGTYDFGQGGTDFQDFLDIEKYIKTAQEEDLFVILRAGPYICAEWEFGGLPSWLLRQKDIVVRSFDDKFMDPVRRYFNTLLPILAALQFTQGGPVIAIQIENEYASGGLDDKDYLRALKDLMTDNGIVELLFTADGLGGSDCNAGGLPDLFKMRTGYSSSLDISEYCQPNQTHMMIELWDGWFDHVTDAHHQTRTNLSDFQQEIKNVLNFPGSLNLYMFEGGTSFGFMNGANGAEKDNANYDPVVSSYDYDAPLNEAGDTTDKYNALVDILNQYAYVHTQMPDTPSNTPKTSYDDLPITEILEFDSILDQIDSIQSDNVISMENLPINNGAGQQYGYIVYQKKNLDIAPNSTLKIEGRVCDALIVRLNGKVLTEPLTDVSQLDGFGYWGKKDGELNLGSSGHRQATLELVVENWGRNGFGQIPDAFNQLKGLWQGNVLINDDVINDWSIYPLEFRKDWLNGAKGWKDYDDMYSYETGPALYRAILQVDDTSADTFIDVRKWTQGFVAVNGFVIGRYASISPQYFMYLPAPFLKEGKNEIIFYEHFAPNDVISFSNTFFFRK